MIKGSLQFFLRSLSFFLIFSFSSWFFSSQNSPVNNFLHEHSNSFPNISPGGALGLHRPPFLHGFFRPHGVTSQSSPEYPALHVHWYELPTTSHVPKFSQGSAVHGVISQSVPLKPAGHSHLYPLPTSTHVPSFWHGRSKHGPGSQSCPKLFHR